MDLADAVSKTLAYSAYFNFPLSPQEIHYWLVSPTVQSFSQIKPFLGLELSPQDQKKRLLLKTNSLKKTQLAQKLIPLLSKIPYIRLVALTGSVAAENSSPTDDIDLLIVTAPHTLWLVRPLVLFLLSLKYQRRHPGDSLNKINNRFCPNLWLDISSLAVPVEKRNLYTAHEVLQIKPLLDREAAYQTFIQNNFWAGNFLANAYAKTKKPLSHKISKQYSNFLLAPLNYLSFLLQYLYMLPKKTTETVSLHSAYFHTTDYHQLVSKHLSRKSL